ncbi:MAG: protein kinase [Polyangiaceae bacterium]
MLEVTGQAGQVMAGRYRLMELVGRGGMGCVWRAEHLSLGTPVAVKLIHAHVAARPGMPDRFRREAKAAALLRSTHVVQILDHGVDAGAPFIAMEFLEGESLAARLARETRLTPEVTARVLGGVAEALARAHRLGIVHRDLKPDNVFLARDGTTEVAKVLDFGIAKLLGPLDAQEHRSTETGTMLGTPCYMSPEQARGRKEMDARSDLWSFAVIAFECLAGRRPFDASALGELMMQICSEPVPVPSAVAEVPEGFDAWFIRATEREPDARFQSIQELAGALSAILTPGHPWLEGADSALDSPSSSEQASSSAGSVPPGGRRRRFTTMAAVAVGALAVVAAIRGVPWPGGAPAEGSPGASMPVVDSASPAQTSSAEVAVSSGATSALSAPAPAPDLRRVRLSVAPADVAVEIDGAAARVESGSVEIAGTLGSLHQVRVFKGAAFTEGAVSITDSGAFPPRIELGSPALSGPALSASGSRPPASGERDAWPSRGSQGSAKVAPFSPTSSPSNVVHTGPAASSPPSATAPAPTTEHPRPREDFE